MNSAVSKKIQHDVFGGILAIAPAQEAPMVVSPGEQKLVAGALDLEFQPEMIFNSDDNVLPETWKNIKHQYLMLCFFKEMGLDSTEHESEDTTLAVLQWLTRQLERKLLGDQFPPPKYARWLGDEAYEGWEKGKSTTIDAKHAKSYIELEWMTNGKRRKYEPWDSNKFFDAAVENVWEMLPEESRLKICAVFSPPWGVLGVCHDTALTEEEIMVCMFTCFLYNKHLEIT